MLFSVWLSILMAFQMYKFSLKFALAINKYYQKDQVQLNMPYLFI